MCRLAMSRAAMGLCRMDMCRVAMHRMGMCHVKIYIYIYMDMNRMGMRRMFISLQKGDRTCAVWTFGISVQIRKT